VLLVDWVLPPAAAAAVDYCNVVDKSASAVRQPDYDLMILLDTILAAVLHYFVVAVAAMMMAEVDVETLEELQQFVVVVVVDDLEKAAMIQYEVAAAPNYPELVWMMEPH